MTSTKHLTIDASLIQAYMADAQAAMNINPQLQRCGINPLALSTPGTRIPFDKVGKLFNRVRVLMKDEEHGRLEKAVPLGYYRLLLLSIVHGDTLEQALGRMLEFMDVRTSCLRHTLQHKGQQWVCTLAQQPKTKTLSCGTVDLHLSAILRIVSWLGNRVITPTLVKLSFPPPPYHNEYRYLYYGASVLFNQTTNAISFNHDVLSHKVVQTENSVHQYLQHAPRDLFFPSYFAGDTTEYIREQIYTKLQQTHSTPSLEQLAGTLQCSSQTLRRRLLSEGTNLHDIKLQVRRDAAIEHLGNTKLSIETIAEQVGYTETSNFVRAFKGWTGLTPLQFRKRL